MTKDKYDKFVNDLLSLKDKHEIIGADFILTLNQVIQDYLIKWYQSLHSQLGGV